MTVWRRCREAGAEWKSVPEGSFPQLLLFVNFNIADEIRSGSSFSKPTNSMFGDFF